MDSCNANCIFEELDFQRKKILGFKSWLEQFSGWLCLIHDAYRPELREAINSADPIRSFRNHDQTMKSKRPFHLLQQKFSGYSKIENLIKSQISALGITESNGFELLRLIKIWSLGISWAVHQVSSEEVRSFARHRARSVDRDWIFSFNVGSFCYCSPAARCPNQWRWSVFAVYEKFAWESARVFSIASECHDSAAGFPWSSGLLYQNKSSRWHGFNPCDTACGEATRHASTAERRAIWPRIVRNPRSAVIVARKPVGGGKGRGKGGRKTKGRGKGNKFRGVDGEEEQDDQEYDEEYEEEDQGEDHPEPDPSAGGSVKQIHEQITMCVKDQDAGNSRIERPVTEAHRVDEMNLSEKFQYRGRRS